MLRILLTEMIQIKGLPAILHANTPILVYPSENNNVYHLCLNLRFLSKITSSKTLQVRILNEIKKMYLYNWVIFPFRKQE